MQTIKAASVLVVMSVTAYALWLTTDTIVWFAREAASLALLSVRVCGGLLIVLVATGAAWLLLRQQYERNRQRDGAFALREYWLAPWWVRLGNWLAGRPNARLIYDPNANMSHAAIVHDNIYIVEPSAGWDRQLAYQQDIERTRRTQAAVPGDGVLGLPWWAGSGAGAGVANAATGRLLAGAYDRQPRPVTVTPPPLPAPELPPPPALTPGDAVRGGTRDALVMGQTDGGDLVRWDMTRTPHLRLHGMTRGSGKTNVAQTLLAGAIASGAHGVVFDPAGLKDWQDFAGCAELVDAGNPATLADGAARLLTIYHNRTRQLVRAGARDVSQMTNGPRRIVVVIAEFGAQCELARAEGVISAVETPLLQLARKAAATGIHLVLEDQVVERWPRGMAGNAVPVIGRMPAYAGQACGYVGRGGVTTETFAPFQFAFERSLFRAPHMQPALRTLLAGMPAPRQLVMLTPPYVLGEASSQPVHGAANEAVHGQFTASSPEVAPPPPTPVNYAPTTVEGWYEWALDHYLPSHPELLQTDDRGRGMGVKALAEAMAGANGKDYEAMKGSASEVARRIRSAATLPGGQPLGVDITGSNK